MLRGHGYAPPSPTALEYLTAGRELRAAYDGNARPARLRSRLSAYGLDCSSGTNAWLSTRPRLSFGR